MRKAITAFAAAMLFSGTALPHKAPMGWEYDSDCCNTADCAPIPDHTVREVQGGFLVHIEPGEHFLVTTKTGAKEKFFVHGDTHIRASGDSGKHACVWKGEILCVYVPPGGV